MLKHFVQSIDKSYKWDFLKVLILKRSMKEAMRNSFRRASYT